MTKTKFEVGTEIHTATYRVGTALYWFLVPAGMSEQEAFDSHAHHGPFATQPEANEDQRMVLLGEQCEVTENPPPPQRHQ